MTRSETHSTPLSQEPEVVVRAQALSKKYQLFSHPMDRLWQMLWRGRRLFGREFWALRDVNFELRRGEMLGVIGRNGSGKSTLLQLIAGTLSPSGGEIEVHGRIGALLELGSGFNPQFSGRENVFLNGAILGLSRKEIEARFAEIEAFADIGDFINRPVKTYSSGMFVRLAFAVQACVDPDILLIDEALAVGDIFFRQKCYNRLSELRKRGTSIIFVTHSMRDVEQLCEHGLLLDHGKPIFYGSASEAVKHYYLLEQKHNIRKSPQPTNISSDNRKSPAKQYWPEPIAFFDIRNTSQVSNGWARCTAVGLCDSKGNAARLFLPGETASFFYEFEILQDIDVPVGGISLQNDQGIIVHGKNSLQQRAEVPLSLKAGERVRFRQDIKLDIAPADYTFTVGLAVIESENYLQLEELSQAEVHQACLRVCHLPQVGVFGVRLATQGEHAHLEHHGVANLSGQFTISVEVRSQEPEFA